MLRNFVALGVSLAALPASRGSDIVKESLVCKAIDREPICTTGKWNESKWTARVAFRASQNETGWATIVVETADKVDDDLAAYAAGLLEGKVSARMIADSYRTFQANGQALGPKVEKFVKDQVAFMNSKIAEAASSNVSEDGKRYWKSVDLTLRQLKGMAAGYALVAHEQALPALTEDDLMMLNLNWELSDIKRAVEPDHRPDYDSMTDAEFLTRIRLDTHCSALLRVTPDLSDLLAAHTTWSTYASMLRIYKVYKLRLSTSAADTVMFSSFPAVLPSADDFFTTSEKLVIIETTNNVFNNSLFDYVVPETVPYWVRATVATRMATDARNWHDIFYRYNSGTYNNQWMVADYKLFRPGQELPPWTFSVSEQIPGPFFHPGEDQTVVLARGHWPSYNVAYYKDVYEMSGYPDQVKKRGPEVSYQLAPRASIFRRDAENVNSLKGMQKFMRENNYGTGDPLAKTPASAIACRGDLMPGDPSPDGAIDAKIVNKDLMDGLGVRAIAGPTTDVQTPFEYSGRFASVPHFGQPDRFNFDWATITLEGMVSDVAPADSRADAQQVAFV